MPYFLVLFERSSASPEEYFDPGPELAAHVRETVAAGQLLLGGTLRGPFTGMGILKADGLDAAREIVERNPTVGRTTEFQLLEIEHPVGTFGRPPSNLIPPR